MAEPTQVESVRTDALHANPRNARTHSNKQLKLIIASIEAFGFLVAILALRSGQIISGHARWLAAKRLGLELVPVRYIDHLSEAQVRAFAIADNRLAELAGWDKGVLAQDIIELQELEINLDLTGFSVSERDLIIDMAEDASPTRRTRSEDTVVDPAETAVTRPGDLWRLGRHRLLCGDALKPESYDDLMDGRRARMVFTDPPYNLPNEGFTGGLGGIRHRDFKMAGAR